MESAHERFLFASCDATNERSERDVLRIFHDRHISKIGSHLSARAKTPSSLQFGVIIQSQFTTIYFFSNFAICLYTNLLMERFYFEKKDKDNWYF